MRIITQDMFTFSLVYFGLLPPRAELASSTSMVCTPDALDIAPEGSGGAREGGWLLAVSVPWPLEGVAGAPGGGGGGAPSSLPRNTSPGFDPVRQCLLVGSKKHHF